MRTAVRARLNTIPNGQRLRKPQSSGCWQRAMPEAAIKLLAESEANTEREETNLYGSSSTAHVIEGRSVKRGRDAFNSRIHWDMFLDTGR